MNSNTGLTVISALVLNHFGVLNRVTSLFSRRGYNIKALVVGETEDSNVSKIAILVDADEKLLVQIKKQLDKLEEVKQSTITPNENMMEEVQLLIQKLI